MSESKTHLFILTEFWAHQTSIDRWARRRNLEYFIGKKNKKTIDLFLIRKFFFRIIIIINQKDIFVLKQKLRRREAKTKTVITSQPSRTHQNSTNEFLCLYTLSTGAINRKQSRRGRRLRRRRRRRCWIMGARESERERERDNISFVSPERETLNSQIRIDNEWIDQASCEEDLSETKSQLDCLLPPPSSSSSSSSRSSECEACNPITFLYVECDLRPNWRVISNL